MEQKIKSSTIALTVMASELPNEVKKSSFS